MAGFFNLSAAEENKIGCVVCKETAKNYKKNVLAFRYVKY